MNFAAKLTVGLVKVLIVFCGLQITVLAQDMQCTALSRRISQCILVEHHPSGPMVTTDLRSPKEKLPYKREIKGARSGSFVIGRARLALEMGQTWVITLSNSEKFLLLSSNDPPLKVIRIFREAGYVWQIRVTAQGSPIEMVGVATEGEMKLDLEIIRKN